MARNNPNWGLVRISGEMLKLKFKRCPTTVKNVLRKAGIEPPPYKCRSTGRWDRFMKVHKEVWQTDFAVYPLLNLSSNAFVRGVKMNITNELKENVIKWCEALRSGEYKQITGRLESANGLCCLGVACKVFIPEDKQEFKEGGLLRGGGFHCQSNSPGNIRDLISIFQKLGGQGLMSLNDTMGLTFDEIADVLEAIIIHEVL